MQSISRIIALIIPVLLFGDATRLILSKEAFKNRIPERFMFGKTAYKIEIIMKIDTNERIYDDLYQVVPEDNDGKHILQFVQVKAEEEVFMPDVPKYFFARYGRGGALFRTAVDRKFQNHVSHRLNNTLDAVTNRIIKVIEPENVKESNKRSEPVAFVEIPEIELTHFDFRSFSPILHLTPSKNKKFTECTLEPSKFYFLHILFETSYIFKMDTDSTTFNQSWSLKLEYEPAVFNGWEPRKIMVYSMGTSGGIELYEMKCKWKEKLDDGYTILHSGKHFVIKKHSAEDEYMPMYLRDNDPRFYYVLSDETDSRNDIYLVEDTGATALASIYKNEDIFYRNGLHTIVAPFHYKCNETGILLPLPYSQRETLSLKEFREVSKSLCDRNEETVAKALRMRKSEGTCGHAERNCPK